MSKICKFAVITVFVGILGLVAQSAKATPIKDISIPMLGVTYNSMSHDFAISGFSSDLSVSYEDSTETVYTGLFVLGTSGMSSEMSNEGKTIAYTGTGDIDLLNLSDYSKLLVGSLESLEMTVINPTLGLFEGLGHFSVTEGSLAADFGDYGGLASVGLSFNMPLNFLSSFVGIANTNLYPDVPDSPQASHAPEPSTILLMGTGLLGLAGYGRKRFSKKS